MLTGLLGSTFDVEELGGCEALVRPLWDHRRVELDLRGRVEVLGR